MSEPACRLVLPRERAAADSPGPPVEPIHPLFSGTRAGDLHGRGTQNWDRATATYLAFRINRNPRDLLAHTRRVLALHRLGRGEACYAALLDLFTVLGGHGEPLKRRLLARVSDLLDGAQRALLRVYLRAGDMPLDRARVSRLCRLARPGNGLRLTSPAERRTGAG